MKRRRRGATSENGGLRSDSGDLSRNARQQGEDDTYIEREKK